MRTPIVLRKMLQTTNRCLDWFENPKHFNKRTFAQDAEGNDVSELSPEVVSTCLLGAIAKFSPSRPVRKAMCDDLSEHSLNHFGRIPVWVNDDLGLRSVRRLLRLFRAELEKQIGSKK